jgi:nucleoside-diphosphate-sugar epimerase
MERIFITGATGVLGRRVVALLLSKGHEVVALSRSEENETRIKKLGATPRTGDLFKQESMKEVTGDCTSIFHLATHIPQKALPDKPVDWEINDRIRTEGTQNLLRAAEKNKIKKFIQQSVTYLYGNKYGATVDSSTPVAEKLPFMIRSAQEMERLIREYLAVDHIIARFGQFYSNDSFNTTGLIESIKKRKMPLIGKGDFFWNTIHVEDAADAIVFCYENFEILKNRTLNFTDFKPIMYKEILNELSHYLGTNKPVRLPKWIARILLKKDLFKFITASHRIKQEPIINEWLPKHPDFIQGMKFIIDAESPSRGI